MTVNLDKETVERIKAFKAIMDKGRFANGKQVTDTYNLVFGTRLPSTNCASCIRKRIDTMYNQVRKLEQQHAEKQQED